jgi:hypothetical protein
MRVSAIESAREKKYKLYDLLKGIAKGQYLRGDPFRQAGRRRGLVVARLMPPDAGDDAGDIVWLNFTAQPGSL